MKKRFSELTEMEKMNMAVEHVFMKNEEEFIKYDVVSDCINPNNNRPLVKTGDSILSKYYAFRHNKIDYDADASLEANIVYERVFYPIINRLDEKRIRKQCDNEGRYNKYGLKYELGEPDCKGGLSFRGDTMNSVATTNRAYYWRHEEAHMQEEFPWPKEALRLIESYHTMGNFMILPWRDGFSVNQARGCGESKDYFDLYLMAIYNFFLEENGKKPANEISLKFLLKYNHKLCTFFKIYLTMFIDDDNCYPEKHGQFIDDIEDNCIVRSQVLPGWQSFVEKNLFQDFVNPNEYGQHGIPKELWSNHFKEYKANNGLPRKEEQFLEFWQNAADLIEKRSARIYEELHPDTDYFEPVIYNL